jgi:hypothetical protein
MPGMPPELMKLIAGGAGKSAAPPQMPAGAPPQGASPGGAPMSTPQPAAGEKQNAMVNVTLAMDLLEQTLPSLGSESEEGQAVLSVLSKLSAKFGHTRAKSQELVPAELMQLMQSLPQMGGMSPEAKAMGQQPMQMPGMPGGGMPGGQPQPMAA